MNSDIYDALQYTQVSSVPIEWEKDFGKLNWLSSGCAHIDIGYCGKVYDCNFTENELKLENELHPIYFGITESTITVYDYIDRGCVGAFGMKNIDNWETTKAPLLKTIILMCILEFLKEHTECYYK